MFQYMDIFESRCIETQRFKIFCVLYKENFESLCIETWSLEIMNSFALQNLHVRVLKNGDSKISLFKPRSFESPCIETQRFKNLHVSEHGD